MTNFKDHLISAGITFVATFFLMMSLTISNTNFTWTKESIQAGVVAATVAATRSLAKIIYELCSELLSKKDINN